MIVESTLSGEAASGTVLDVVLLLVFLEEEFQVFGHSRGECCMRETDQLWFCLLANRATSTSS